MSQVQSSTLAVRPVGLPSGHEGDVPSGTPTAGNAMETIDQLIAMVQELNIKMRDMETDFSSTMQAKSMNELVNAFNAKKDAIKKEFDASIWKAATEGLSGGLSIAGGLSGETAAVVSGGVGKELTAFGDYEDSKLTTAAKQERLGAEMTDQSAKLSEQTADRALERANEASRQLVQATADLVALQGRMLDAVRF